MRPAARNLLAIDVAGFSSLVGVDSVAVSSLGVVMA
jgi:hypothetical protein